jgi:hypothetical protein
VIDIIVIWVDAKTSQGGGKTVQGKTVASKIGWAVFLIGGLYMLGMGWLYSWWMVPAAN